MKTCQWIAGDPVNMTDAQLVNCKCNASTLPGKSWCAVHAEIARRKEDEVEEIHFGSELLEPEGLSPRQQIAPLPTGKQSSLSAMTGRRLKPRPVRRLSERGSPVS